MSTTHITNENVVLEQNSHHKYQNQSTRMQQANQTGKKWRKKSEISNPVSEENLQYSRRALTQRSSVNRGFLEGLQLNSLKKE